MWRELITELHREVEPIGDLDPGPDFFPGAALDEVARAEQQLGVVFPASLRELLIESDGVHVVFGQRLIWSTREVVQQNIEMRTQPEYTERYMPFDHLLFFADAGVDGILFAFGIVQGKIPHENVYGWYPIEDGRPWKAPSLRTYIEWWLTGGLKV